MVAFEGVVVEVSPQLRRLLNGRSVMEALERAAPRAMILVAADIRARAPRGKTGKLGRGFDVAARRIRGLAGGVEVAIGARVPYGHLVAGGHRIIARGPTRKDRRLSRVARAAARSSLKQRRILGGRGFVPGNPFVTDAFASRGPDAVRLLERLIAQDLTR